MIILVGAIIGLVLALFLPIHVPPEYTKYIAVGILAGLDSIIGGISASLRGRFDMRVFTSGFIINAIIASALTFLGNKLDIDISLAAIVTFGSRIFQNFAVIRRLLLNKKRNHSTIENEE